MSEDSLRIAELETEPGGKIGLTLCPGKKGPSACGGWHDRDLDADLNVVAAWNAAAVVTLIEDHEFETLKVRRLADEVCSRFMEWHHLPIEDVSAPDERFDAAWRENSRRLRGLLSNGANVLIHCRGGLGRAGTVAARLLVEMGAVPAEAIAKVREVRRGAIETPAQEEWVKRGKTAIDDVPATEAARDRAIGALVGLAVGDAVGTTIEFSAKPDRMTLKDMVGGGPFGLRPGEWTDDTAMALALADSLLVRSPLDPADLMNRFVRWRERGEYSCTGRCFDIGNTVADALRRFKRTGDPLAGSTHPQSAGNGALMRLSPAAVRYWNDINALRENAELQTRTTHAAQEAIDASLTYAELLASAIAGAPLHRILASEVATRVKGGFQGLHRDAIRGSGYVVHSLQAALWAVSRTTSFRTAVLLAANLGEDSDTTAAVAGQMAGAVYGLSGMPRPWITKLAWRDKIVRCADQLFEASSHRRPGSND